MDPSVNDLLFSIHSLIYLQGVRATMAALAASDKRQINLQNTEKTKEDTQGSSLNKAQIHEGQLKSPRVLT